MNTTDQAPATLLGYEFLANLPEDGKIHEIIGGIHYVTPSPSTNHQTVSKRLQFHLYSKIELQNLGIVFSAPLDVQLSEHDIVEPDLIVVLKRNEQVVIPSRILGIPDLLVEILSPTHPNRDRQLKRSLYERVGVPEYWIVDPDQRTVTQLALRSSRYEEVTHGDEIRLTTLPDVVIHLSEIW